MDKINQHNGNGAGRNNALEKLKIKSNQSMQDNLDCSVKLNVRDVNIERLRTLGCSKALMKNINHVITKTIIESLWQKGLLELNSTCDWSVSRTGDWTAKDMGFKDLKEIIESRHDFLLENTEYNGKLRVRDLGPGDGSLINSLGSILEQDNIEITGVGNRLYIDMYSILKRDSYLIEKIPKNIVVLFVRKFVKFVDENKQDYKSINKLIEDAIGSIRFDDNLLVRNDTMFDEKTIMFSDGNYKELPKQSIEFLESEEGEDKIQSLKNELSKTFMTFVKIPFEKIFISDFENFFSNIKKITKNKDILESNIHISCRSTSHLYNDSYKKFIEDCVDNLLTKGGLMIEDGVLRSYSYEIRINELWEIWNCRKDKIAIYIVTDDDGRLVSSVIEKKPIEGIKKWNSRIDESYNIRTIEEMKANQVYQVEVDLKKIIATFIENIYIDSSVEGFSFIKPQVKKLFKNLSMTTLLSGKKELKKELLKTIEIISQNYLKNALIKSDFQNCKTIWEYALYKTKLLDFIDKYFENKLDLTKDERQSGKKDQILEELLIRLITKVKLSKKEQLDIKAHYNVMNHLLTELFMRFDEFVRSSNIEDDAIVREINSTKNALDGVFYKEINSIMQSANIELNEKFWKNVKVLIVEDSTTLQILFDRFVMTLGCKRENIQAVSNGREAVSLSAKNEFDLIFMDINMPEMNGDDAAKLIKKRKKGEYIIALTSTEKIHFQNQYFDGYIQKGANTTNSIQSEVGRMESLIESVLNKDID